MVGSPPWWRDFDKVPTSTSGAQPLWIHGQWQFIAFTADGIPLRRLCRDVTQANTDVSYFDKVLRLADAAKSALSNEENEVAEQLADDEKQRIRDTLLMAYYAGTDEQIPTGYTVFAISEDPEEGAFVVLRPDGTLVTTAFRYFTELETWLGKDSLLTFKQGG